MGIRQLDGIPECGILKFCFSVSSGRSFETGFIEVQLQTFQILSFSAAPGFLGLWFSRTLHFFFFSSRGLCQISYTHKKRLLGKGKLHVLSKKHECKNIEPLGIRNSVATYAIRKECAKMCAEQCLSQHFLFLEIKSMGLMPKLQTIHPI